MLVPKYIMFAHKSHEILLTPGTRRANDRPTDPILLLQADTGYCEQVADQYLLQHIIQIFVLNKTFLNLNSSYIVLQ
jgi:hypothetical protein